MSIALYLLTKKGLEVLKTISDDENYLKLIDFVVGARDDGNTEDCYDEIQLLCKKFDIPFFNRKNHPTNNSKYSIAIGWRWLIKDVKGLIVFHDSLLPKYRGFSPIVNMLINNEKYLAATAIWATDMMDEGDIISQQKIEISYPIKINVAIEIVSGLYVELIKEILKKLISDNELDGSAQLHTEATYSIWRDKEDYYINWADDARKIVRFINAVGYPYDGAKTRILGGGTIKIIEGSLVENIKSEIPDPGKILMITNAPIVLCGKNAISLDKVEDLDGMPFKFKKLRTRLI